MGFHKTQRRGRGIERFDMLPFVALMMSIFLSKPTFQIVSIFAQSSFSLLVSSTLFRLCYRLLCNCLQLALRIPLAPHFLIPILYRCSFCLARSRHLPQSLHKSAHIPPIHRLVNDACRRSAILLFGLSTYTRQVLSLLILLLLLLLDLIVVIVVRQVVHNLCSCTNGEDGLR